MRVTPFLDQAFKEFEHCLDSIIMGCIEAPELDISFDEADAISSSVSSGFLCSVSTSLLTKPQLGHSIKSHKL